MVESVRLNTFLLDIAQGESAVDYAKRNINVLRNLYNVHGSIVVMSAKTADRMKYYGATDVGVFGAAKVSIGKSVGIRLGSGTQRSLDAHIGIGGDVETGTQVDCVVLPSTHANYPDGVGDAVTHTFASRVSTHTANKEFGDAIALKVGLDAAQLESEGINVTPDNDKVIVSGASVVVASPPPAAPDAASGNTIGVAGDPAQILVVGTWAVGDQISVDFSTDVVNGGTPVGVALGGENSAAMAVILAAALEAATNVTATAVGSVVNVLPDALATEVLIGDVTVTIA